MLPAQLQMEKTTKTMAELEIDQNIKHEWDSITEAGAMLKPLSGPGCALSRCFAVWYLTPDVCPTCGNS